MARYLSIFSPTTQCWKSQATGNMNANYRHHRHLRHPHSLKGVYSNSEQAGQRNGPVTCAKWFRARS